MQVTDSIKTLATYLEDWEDIDIAAYRLAMCLGLMPDDNFETFRTAKSIFWTNNELGNKLYTFINVLIDMNILERESKEDKIRWNPSHKGSWE